MPSVGVVSSSISAKTSETRENENVKGETFRVGHCGFVDGSIVVTKQGPIQPPSTLSPKNINMQSNTFNDSILMIASKDYNNAET
jgi:hypothetical protein